MKIHHIMRICCMFAIYLVVGCTTTAVDHTPTPRKNTARIPATYAPENQYYYFTAAQIQRKKGNLDKGGNSFAKPGDKNSFLFLSQRDWLA